MNKAILMGRLTRDPEVRYSTGERSIAIARYTLAVDRRGKNRETDFVQCVAFDKAGEFAEKYFRKGMRVLVSGRIQTGSYTNRDGVKVNTTEIVLDDQEFADSKGGETDVQKARAEDMKKAQERAPREDREPDYKQESFMTVPDSADDEGLPFN